jgi:hypothetical protein
VASAAREQIRRLREDLSSRRRNLAAANALLPHHAGSSSPPVPTLPGSFPGQSPFSNPPQNTRPLLAHHRQSSTAHTAASPSRTQSTSRGQALHGTRLFGTPSTPSSTSPSPFKGQSPVSLNTVNTAADREADRQIDEATYQLTAMADTVARARSGLVQELVEVFSVVEVGGRPPIGGKAGTKGEWTIGGLVLPVPGDMRRAFLYLIIRLALTLRAGYPPDHINAVITHTLHFLSLLAFYLGIKLPFEVLWSRSSTPPTGSQFLSPASPNLRGNGLLGVGTPWIGATKGTEHGGWAKCVSPNPVLI